MVDSEHAINEAWQAAELEMEACDETSTGCCGRQSSSLRAATEPERWAAERDGWFGVL